MLGVSLDDPRLDLEATLRQVHQGHFAWGDVLNFLDAAVARAVAAEAKLAQNADDALRDLAKECHVVAMHKGRWDVEVKPADVFALLHLHAAAAFAEWGQTHSLSAVGVDPDGSPRGVPNALGRLLALALDAGEMYQMDLPAALRRTIQHYQSLGYKPGRVPGLTPSCG